MIQFSSVAQSYPTLCDPMNRSMPGLPVHHKLPEFTQTHVHRVSDAIQPSHPLSSLSPHDPDPSQHQGLFQWVTLHMRWPKYWSFSFSISPSNEHPGLISFRIDWLDLRSPRDSQESSPTPQFKNIDFLVLRMISSVKKREGYVPKALGCLLFYEMGSYIITHFSKDFRKDLGRISLLSNSENLHSKLYISKRVCAC